MSPPSPAPGHRTVLAAVAANVAIAAAKFAVAVRQSRRAPDERHPFGHGKELYFWLAAADPAVDGVERALTVHFGPDTVVLNLDLRFRRGLRAGDVVEAVARIERALRGAHPELKFIFVEGSALAAAAP